MKLREYLIDNLDKLKEDDYEQIKVKDIQKAQGVYISLHDETDLNAVLEDKPVIPYLDFYIYGEVVDYKTLELYVHKDEYLNGWFYLFDCMGVICEIPGLPDNVCFTTYFDNDREAVKVAVDYESYLYKVKYEDGVKTDSIALYEPMML
ncbi:MAG: hypothetical protein HUJ56_06865 [Erysipelotrichaceae bacterium]|nr:hypothetical protein [Erysipelotrichaceae bacterium]